jgi:hypothetical protein
MGAILTSVQTNTMLRSRLINSIQNMLRVQNSEPTFEYTFLNRYSEQQLQQMMSGWQQNQPQLFNTHGIYVL